MFRNLLRFIRNFQYENEKTMPDARKSYILRNFLQIIRNSKFPSAARVVMPCLIFSEFSNVGNVA